MQTIDKKGNIITLAAGEDDEDFSELEEDMAGLEEDFEEDDDGGIIEEE